jgi:hypothetical protein
MRNKTSAGPASVRDLGNHGPHHPDTAATMDAPGTRAEIAAPAAAACPERAGRPLVPAVANRSRDSPDRAAGPHGRPTKPESTPEPARRVLARLDAPAQDRRDLPVRRHGRQRVYPVICHMLNSSYRRS